MKISSTKPHEEALRIDFIFVILRVAPWMIFLGANEKAFGVPPSGGSGRMYPSSRLLKTPSEGGTPNASIESEFRS
jgi:hypothetical protein